MVTRLTTPADTVGANLFGNKPGFRLGVYEYTRRQYTVLVLLEHVCTAAVHTGHTAAVASRYATPPYSSTKLLISYVI